MNKLNRREFLGTTALAASASAALGAAPGVPQPSAMATLEGTGQVWPIWRNPGRFTKNPDIVRFPSGKMMLVFSDSDQHWAQGITRITTLHTTDEGKTWGNPKVIAEADVRKGEERWITPRITFDQGPTWAPPKSLPFSGDRPFVGQMADGRVLVTYRNQSGNAGTNAWLGDLFTDYGYQVFGTHYGDACEIQDGTLHINNQTDGETRYTLMPPENFRSNIVLEATLRVEGPADNAIATFNIGRIGLRAYVLRDQIWLDFGRGGQGPNPAHPTHPGADARHAVDMTKEHRLSTTIPT